MNTLLEMIFETPTKFLTINGKKYQVYPHFLEKNGRYFENFFDDGSACNIDIKLPFDMGENGEKHILNFLKIANHIETITFYCENISYYYELAVYFGFGKIIDYYQYKILKYSKLHFEEELKVNNEILKVYQNMYEFDIDYDFLTKLFKYNTKLLEKYLNNNMLLINGKYIDVFNQCNDDKHLYLHRLLKNNIRNKEQCYDSFLLNVYDHILPKLIKKLDDFKNKFNEITYNVLLKLPWDNIVVAGGSSLICLLEREIPYNEYSDIDIWVYGKTSEERNNKHKEILEYFKSMFGDGLYFIVNHSVITIIICGVKRNFQIILTKYKHKYQIIQRFDMDYVKCLYDGQNVYGTVDFIESMNSNCASFTDYDEIMRGDLKIYRLFKAYSKGFTIDAKEEKDILESEMKIELKYYYINVKNINDIENINKIFKSQMVLKSFTNGCVNYKNDNDLIKINFPKKNKTKKTITCETYEHFCHHELIVTNFDGKLTVLGNIFKMNIQNVLFVARDFNKMYSHSDEYFEKYNMIIDSLSVNLNYVDKNVLENIKNISNNFIKDSYNTNSIDAYVQNDGDDLYWGASDNVRKEFRYFFPKIKYFENLLIKITKETIIVDIFGNKLTKIPRMSFTTIEVSFNNVLCEKRERYMKGIENVDESYILCEKIVVYPPNYHHNML